MRFLGQREDRILLLGVAASIHAGAHEGHAVTQIERVVLQQGIRVLGRAGILATGFLATVCAFPALASGNTTQLAIHSNQTTVETGKTVQLSLTIDATDQPILGASFDMRIADGFQFSSLSAGSGIEQSELSYNYIEGEIIAVYMDNDAGGSAAGQGTEILTLDLVAVSPTAAEPVTFLSTDVVGGTTTTDIQMDASATADQVNVTGVTVEIPTPEPVLVEDGQQSETPAQNAAMDEQPTSPAAEVIQDAPGVRSGDSNSSSVEQPAEQNETSQSLVVSGATSETYDAADTADNMESEENGQRETVNSSNALILPVIFIVLAVLMVAIGVISFCKRKKQ